MLFAVGETGKRTVDIGVPDLATCLNCGYSLRGLSELRCPECSRTFDPDDPATYKTATSSPWLRWARAPSFWTVVIAVIVVVWIVDDASQQVAPSLWVACLVPLLALSLGVDYVVRVASCLFFRHRMQPYETTTTRRQRWRWAVLPLGAMLVASVMMTNWPMRIRFHYSLPAFEQAVRDIQSGAKVDTGPQWIGLYHIKRITGFGRNSDGELWFVTGSSLFDPVGFCYEPAYRSVSRLSKRLTSNWYATEW